MPASCQSQPTRSIFIDIDWCETSLSWQVFQLYRPGVCTGINAFSGVGHVCNSQCAADAEAWIRLQIPKLTHMKQWRPIWCDFAFRSFMIKNVWNPWPLVIHSVIVLIMNGIKVKISHSTFSWRPTGTPSRTFLGPWDSLWEPPL